MVSISLLAAVAAAIPQPAATAVPAESPSELPPGVPATLRLTATQMFEVAEQASASGDSVTARAFYRALEGDPDGEIRAEARFRQAKLLLAQGSTREAAAALRRLLDEKPAAAAVRLELARTLQLLGDSDGALRELRAARSAGLPPTVARLVDRYSEALRARRPMGASFEIALAPDSNINRATRSDSLGTVFGDFDVDEDSKAKSGTGLALRAQAWRRFHIGSGDSSVLARLSTSADLYSKTRFNDVAADLAVGPELRIGSNRVNVEIGASQRWFGQKPFLRTARIGATLVRPLGTRTQVRVSAFAALIDNGFNDLQDGKGYSGQLGIERALSTTTGVALNLSLERQSLKDPGYSTTGWRAGVIGWREVGQATLTANAEIGRLTADERLALFPVKRADLYSRLTVGGTFRQLARHGFAPVVRFTFERNRSPVAFYDYNRRRTEFAIVRAF